MPPIRNRTIYRRRIELLRSLKETPLDIPQWKLDEINEFNKDIRIYVENLRKSASPV